MPAYKDQKRNTWYVKFYITDYEGKRRQKLKRGFATKRAALAYERSYTIPKGPDITFHQLYTLYMDDAAKRLKHSTLQSKTHIFKNHILPYFGNRRIFDISPADIRSWQNRYLDKDYSRTYLNAIHNQLASIMRYAERFCSLPSNPCTRAGGMGSANADEMECWTRDEFQQFILAFADDEKAKPRLAFNILYWSGLREGELLALTYEDIDFARHEIRVNKTYHRYKKIDYITPPKTPKSNRKVPVPKFLCDDIQAYMDTVQPASLSERIFPNTKDFLCYQIRYGCEKSGVKKIRIHDIRHSHVSLLIHLGFSPVVIAQRVGHNAVSTTLDIYSHMFPHQQDALVAALEELK